MKQLLMAFNQNARRIARALHRLSRNNDFIYSVAIIAASLSFMGCQKQDIPTPEIAAQTTTTDLSEKTGNRNVVFDYPGLTAQTNWELQQARAATARYRNIQNAFADGYADISVVVPNMGHHFLKSGITDATFDIRQPEILVYNPDHDGNFELVAVEYAVPLSLSSTAPAGFTGSADVWDENTGFGLWLLHAWVWSYNPMGVFNSTNPEVHVH